MNKTLKLILLCAAALFSTVANSQNALDFDGTDDKIDCGNDTSIQISGKAITLEAWINPTAWKTNIFDGNVINKEYNTSNYGFMLRVGDGGKLNFAFGDGSWHELNSSSAVLSLNTWQHIAGSYDGTKMRIFVNGLAVDSLSVTAPITNASTTPMIIGGHTTYNRFYQGMIDEVRVWNICLTQQQLYDGMSSELCYRPSGLRAYYKFNQGKASQTNPTVKKLTDLSGYNNSGTLNGFALNGTGSNWLKGQNLKRDVSYAYDTATVCDRYLSTTRRFTWTKTGIYNDTVPTAIMGCDSVIILNLTVRKSTSQTIKAFACNSYVSPSGNLVWTKSGIYTEKLLNKAKCDSIITVILKIGGSRDTISRVVCNAYVPPSGKRTFTLSGTYADTLKGYGGCDSIFVIKLTVNKNVKTSMTVKVCNAYQSPSGKYVYTSAGLYYDTLKTGKGCDSIIGITVQIQKTSGNMKHTTCNAWKSPSGRYTWTVSGIYMDTIVNKAGCDSFLSIDLTVNHASTASKQVIACFSYTSEGKKHKWVTGGIYKDTMTNHSGCDSIITINLIINSVTTAVTQNLTDLRATSVFGVYQWLDCNNAMAAITGATGQVFKPKKIGDYAVAVTENACVDTSICYSVTKVTGIEEQTFITFQILPNPSSGTFRVVLPAMYYGVSMIIRDISGRTVYEKSFDELLNHSVELNELSGLYFIELSAGDYKITRCLSINR